MTPRILMTHPTSLGRPGGGTVGFLEIARALAAEGADVTLLVVNRGPWEPVQAPVETICLPPIPGHRYLDAFRVSRETERLCRQRGFDAVLGWASEAAWLPRVAAAAGARFGIFAAKPSYRDWWERDVAFRGLKRITDTVVALRPMRRADLVCVLSEATKRELVSLFGLDPARVLVDHWGVDPVFGRVPSRDPGQPLRHLLFHGSLDAQKGIFDALAALGRLGPGSADPWELRVAGWGDEAAVMRAAADAGIGDRVRMLGTLGRRELIAELARAQLAVLPSRVESFGLAIAEAQAAGLPVVSYCAGSVPEVVQDGRTGFLVPVGDIDLLADRIATLLADPARAVAMGEAGRAHIAGTFRWERTARRLLDGLFAREAVAS